VAKKRNEKKLEAKTMPKNLKETQKQAGILVQTRRRPHKGRAST